jgi:DNA polymerase I
VLPELKALQESPETRAEWIDYSTLDTEATWLLRESLECKLRNMPADASQYVNEDADFPPCATMWEFYEQYWKPFGDILAGMESAGMRVDNRQLEEAEKLALTEQAAAERRFMAWASARCEDARWMNVGSGAQARGCAAAAAAGSWVLGARWLPARRRGVRLARSR